MASAGRDKLDMHAHSSAQQHIYSEWFDAIVPAPFGSIGVRLTQDKQALFELVYLPEGSTENQGDTALAQQAYQQITRYLKNPQHRFDLPTVVQGTDFQNKVWQEINQIECGQVLSYKQVGKLIGCGSPRAVGGACGANPYPLIVPCHRVVAASGIGGFARHDDGFHIGVKRWLLQHEGVEY